MSAGTRIRLVFTGLCYGLRIREVFKAFIFQLIFGIAPTFLIYLNEYVLLFAGLTVADYWRVQMFGWVVMILAVLVYALFLQQLQYRWPLAIGTLFSLGGSLFTMLLIKSSTYQLLPWMFSATMSDLVYSALTQMPLGALFCKVIPDKIETSMFALCMCLTSSSRVTTPIIGSFYAKFIDSSIFFPEFYKLFIIQAIFAMISLISVLLVPLRDDISKVQACLAYMRKADSSSLQAQ